MVVAVVKKRHWNVSIKPKHHGTCTLIQRFTISSTVLVKYDESQGLVITHVGLHFFAMINDSGWDDNNMMFVLR